MGGGAHGSFGPHMALKQRKINIKGEMFLDYLTYAICRFITLKVKLIFNEYLLFTPVRYLIDRICPKIGVLKV